MKVLGPQISALQGESQQAKNTTAQFGNRSGGNNASMQMIGDKTRANVKDLISSLTGSAVGQQASLGSSLLGQGMQAYQTQAGLSQEQMANWQQSILGGLTGGIFSTLGQAASAGLGKVPGLSSVI